MIRKRPSLAGFTLLEVMVALSLLAMGLVVLLDAQGGGMQMTRYAKNLTVATQLARARMAFLMQQVEDQKVPFGLSKSSCKEGDFDDEGKAFEGFKWKYCIKKVEIAEPTNLPGLGGGGEKKGDGDEAGAARLAQAQGLLGSMGISMNQNTDPQSILSSMGPMMGMIQGQMKTVFKQLQESLREIQIVITWKQDKRDYRLAVTTHLFNFDRNTGLPNGWPAQQPQSQ